MILPLPLHHAYILEGSTLQSLISFIERELQISVQGNPDVWIGKHETFSIDDARTLREAQANKSISGNKKIFIIEIFGMTVEAQNSLLKVLEEPTPDTHFFILASSAEIFLPTLKSRVQIISENSEERENKIVKEFIKASIPDRLKLVGEIAEEKDKAQALILVDGLLHALHTKGNKNVLEEVLKVRGYLNDRSPSLKLLLEHIAMIV